MVIKVQQRQVQPQTVRLSQPMFPSVNPDAFGQDVARAQGEMGEAVGELGNLLGQRALQKQKEKNDRYMLDIDTNYRKAVNNKLWDPTEETVLVDGQQIKRKKGLLLREGVNAKGVTQEFDKWADEYLGKISEASYTEEMRTRLMESSGRFSASVRGNLITHEVKQDNIVTQTAYETEMDALTNDDAVFATNGGLPDLLTLIKQTSDDFAMSKGITDETAKQAFAQQYINKAVDTAVETAFQEDISGFKAFTVLEQAKAQLGPYYEDKKQSMIAIFDKQQAINNFGAVLAKNKLDDDLKSMVMTGDLTLQKLNVIRDQNPIQMDDRMYDGYKKLIESQEAVFGVAKPEVGYELLSDFSKIFGTISVGDLKKKSGQGKFDDVLKLRAKVIDERAKGNIDDDMMKTLNTLFEASTTQNKNFAKYSAPYLAELTNMENFAKKIMVQEVNARRSEGFYKGRIPPSNEAMADSLVFQMFAELVDLTGGNKLQPIKSAKDLQVLQAKAEEVRQAFSAEIARNRYNIQKNTDDGFEYVTTPDGASFKVMGYSYGAPLIDFKQGMAR